MREAVPSPLGFAEHWQRLGKIYARATEVTSTGGQDWRDLGAARVFEELAVQLEDRSRNLDGVASAAEAASLPGLLSVVGLFCFASKWTLLQHFDECLHHRPELAAAPTYVRMLYRQDL